jgi:predicted ArsR family transcriptional regulator
MRKNLVLGAGRGPRLAVLEQIKRAGRGMSVADLAETLGMSYMGVKSHCVALSASGHLTVWREPVTERAGKGGSKGRPRLLYRLADSGERLFADAGDQLALALLREAARLYGPTAPQKLLVMMFRAQQTLYREKISGGGLEERVTALVLLREKEGRMSMLRETVAEEGNTWEIRECHNPLAMIMKANPEARTLEDHMISEVLGVTVDRREEGGTTLFSPAIQAALTDCRSIRRPNDPAVSL